MSKPQRIPTPPIGWPVQYFPKGHTDNQPGAAVVKKHGAAPGVVDLVDLNSRVVSPPKGTVWIDDESERHKPGSICRENGGCWRYLPGMAIPEEHYEWHDRLVAARGK